MTTMTGNLNSLWTALDSEVTHSLQLIHLYFVTRPIPVLYIYLYIQ